MRLRITALSLMCLQGCSSNPPAEPDAPEVSSAAKTGAPAADEAPAGASEEPPGQAAAADASASGASAANAVDEVLAAVLTHADFAEYLHPSVAGRVPVVVSGKARPTATVSLQLHGAPVEVKAPADLAPEQPVIDITAWRVDGDRASVTFDYEVEGVRASFQLQRDPTKGWAVTDASVVEH